MAAKMIDPENPEWTEDDFARAKPASEVLPAPAAALLTRKQGRPPLDEAARKVPVSIRLSPDVLEALRATGKGWQTRADDILRAALDVGSAAKPKEVLSEQFSQEGAEMVLKASLFATDLDPANAVRLSRDAMSTGFFRHDILTGRAMPTVEAEAARIAEKIRSVAKAPRQSKRAKRERA